MVALGTFASPCDRPSPERFHLVKLKLHALNGDRELPLPQPPAAAALLFVSLDAALTPHRAEPCGSCPSRLAQFTEGDVPKVRPHAAR